MSCSSVEKKYQPIYYQIWWTVSDEDFVSNTHTAPVAKRLSSFYTSYNKACDAYSEQLFRAACLQVTRKCNIVIESDG